MSSSYRSMGSSRSAGRRRRGITVIEVLFAMGIALMGLAGIASLLLLGGRQAGESSRAAEGQAFAHDWYGEFTARGLNDSSKWAWYKDFPPAGGLRWFHKQLGDPNPANTSAVPSKGPATIHLREFGRESVCFDPMFFSGRDLNNVLDPVRWYRPSVFPYYHDTYNPTVDPGTAVSPTEQWEEQPRMLRVTWATPVPSGTPTPMPSRLLEQVFFSQDDLSVVVEESDNSVAPARGISFYNAAPGPPLPLGRYAAESQYSWLATLSPTEPRASATEITNLYTLSLLVMNKRDRLYMPPVAPLTRGPGSAPMPNNNPQGERLAWIFPLSGNFVGGTGGRVRMISSDGAEPDLHVGDWVMMAKYYNFEYVPSVAKFRPNSVFRWFRIVAVESEETFGTLPQVLSDLPGPPTTDPYGKTPPNFVWAQDVVLEGPDWNFGTPLTVPGPTGNVTIQTPTTATLITGTVGVFERVVNVQ